MVTIQNINFDKNLIVYLLPYTHIVYMCRVSIYTPKIVFTKTNLIDLIEVNAN